MILLTYQQLKTVIAYTLIGVIGFLIYSHIKWPDIDYAIPLFSLVILLFIVYFYADHVRETTLCLIVKDDQVLMMYRNKKKNDVHMNKYNGLGGKLERGESKRRGILREVKEEANIKLTNYEYVGKIRFKNFGNHKTELMYCFVAYEFEGEIAECNEGELSWIDKNDVLSLPLWEGDQYFIMDIINNKKFKGFLHYDGEHVVNHQMKYLSKNKLNNKKFKNK